MTFDAFLSYRRSDGSGAARWLRNRLIGFRFPKSLPAQGARQRLELRIFRDRDYELATADFFQKKIRPALRDSSALMVVVTPDLTKPRPDGSENWCMREIAEFVDLHPDPRIYVACAAGKLPERLPRHLEERFPNIDQIDIRDYRRWRWPLSSRAAELESSVAALAGAIRGIGLENIPLLLREVERRRRRRTLRWLAGLFVVAVLLAVLAGWAVWERGRTQQANRELRRQLVLSVAQRDPDALQATHLLLELRHDPPRSGGLQAALRLLGEPLPMATVPPLEGGVSRPPAFSANGRRVVVVSDSQALVAEAMSGEVLDRIALPGLFDAALSPDGTSLLSLTEDGALRWHQLASGEATAAGIAAGTVGPQERFPEGPEPLGLHSGAFSRDGSVFAWRRRGHLLLVSADRSAPQVVDLGNAQVLRVSPWEAGFVAVCRDGSAVDLWQLDLSGQAQRLPDRRLSVASLADPAGNVPRELPVDAAAISPDLEYLALVSICDYRGCPDDYQAMAGFFEWAPSGDGAAAWRTLAVGRTSLSFDPSWFQARVEVSRTGAPAAVAEITGGYWDYPTGSDWVTLRFDGDEWRRRGPQQPWRLAPDGRRTAGTDLGTAWVDPDGFEIVAPSVRQCAFGPTGRWLITVHVDGQGRIWDLDQASSPWRPTEPDSMQLEPLLDVDEDSRVALPWRSEPLVLPAARELEVPANLSLHAESRRIVGLGRSNVLLWEGETPGQPLRLPRPPRCGQGGPDYEPPEVHVTADGSFVAASCGDDEWTLPIDFDAAVDRLAERRPPGELSTDWRHSYAPPPAEPSVLGTITDWIGRLFAGP